MDAGPAFGLRLQAMFHLSDSRPNPQIFIPEYRISSSAVSQPQNSVTIRSAYLTNKKRREKVKEKFKR